MVAPITRQVLELRSRTFTGVAASQNDTVGSKAPETDTGKKPGSQSRVSVHDSVAEEQEEYIWYVPLLQHRPFSASPSLIQYMKTQSDLSRRHSPGTHGPPDATLHPFFPSEMLRNLDLEDSEALETCASL